ncbi:hypothetical protein RhiirA5_423272 [Rhizophagus irregularis]|uniref:Uncharacterized protein n=1 Tax=Rhizophagus irregularis TaxID=588596 RepID=A0A2N0PAB5_9GLOM|nr:hypothetical protein RhiirA5_423272 [Rhizophagus irregularis]
MEGKIERRNVDKEEEQRRQAKRKTEMEIAFKGRKTNSRSANNGRESLAEWGDDIEADSGQDYKYRRSRWWFHRQQFRARELAIDEAYRLREQQEIELEQHRLQTLEKLWKWN